jgi:PKD repeat protein
VQNPSFTFTKTGSYDVKLVVTNDEESATEIKAGYITIGDFILFQDFNTENFGNWETISVVGDQKWIINISGGEDGSPCAQMNGYSGGNNQNEDWLVSPAITANSFILTFDNTKNFSGDDLKLMVSTNYTGDVSAATWSQLNFTVSTGNYNWVNSGEVKYAPQGGKAHIAFKYTSTASDGALWRVDNIMVRDGGSQSITENSKTEVQVYPNPSSTGIFSITTEGNATIKALSVDGRLIKEQTMSQKTMLDLSTCPQGVYFLQITLENGTMTTQKVIVK